jgi:diguanylate cyclase
MVYTETKEKSAELLRTALGLMNQHDAAFNPITYAVWYEYASGINARLNQALDHLKQKEPRLGNDTIQRLHREFIAGVDDKTMDRITVDFQKVMAGVVETANQTGQEAGAFGAQLSHLSAALEAEQAPALVQALQHTQVMQTSAAALQAKVQTSQAEIQRLRADLERAREEAFIDSLTRILNRKGLDHQLDKLLDQPLPPGGTHGLVMLDIDHFKRINDNHGHLMGDRVLAAVGEVLKASVQPGGHLVARYGGEEFAILMPNATLQQAAELAENVRARTKAMKLRNRTTNEVVLTVTVSAGAATLQAGESGTEWIARADAALYRSKEGGRDRVTCAA